MPEPTTMQLAPFLRHAAKLAQPLYVYREGSGHTYCLNLPNVPYSVDYVICHVDGTITPVPAQHGQPPKGINQYV